MRNPALDLSDIQYVLWRVRAKSGTDATTQQEPAYHPKAWDAAETKSLIYLTDNDGNEYFFDGVFKIEHSSQRRLTMHPVQTGANITDHSFKIPTRVTMEIGVSDSMDIHQKAWSEVSNSKSVNAYQQIIKLQDAGQPLSIATRLTSYDNMVIETVTVPEEYRYINSIRALITFQQIITASAAIIKVSFKKQITDENKLGTKPTTTTNLISPARKLFNALGLVK